MSTQFCLIFSGSRDPRKNPPAATWLAQLQIRQLKVESNKCHPVGDLRRHEETPVRDKGPLEIARHEPSHASSGTSIAVSPECLHWVVFCVLSLSSCCYEGAAGQHAAGALLVLKNACVAILEFQIVLAHEF